MGVRAEVQYLRSDCATPQIISTAEDVDALIDAMLVGPPDHDLADVHSLDRPLLPSGFADHQFLVGVRKEHPIGLLFFGDKDGSYVTKGGPDSPAEPVYYIGGHDTEFPDHSEVPIALVRRAVKEFLLNRGKRPTCVEWQRDWPDLEEPLGAQEQVTSTSSRCCPDMEKGGPQHMCWPPF